MHSCVLIDELDDKLRLLVLHLFEPSIEQFVRRLFVYTLSVVLIQ